MTSRSRGVRCRLWASIGIKKGKPFAPNEGMKRILSEAAAVGNATARALSYRPRGQEPYFYEDRQWYTTFVGGRHDFVSNGELMLNYRTMMHYMATGITSAMAHSEVGKGSAYAFTLHDAEGRFLEGGKTYCVTLPAPVPAAQFWSFVVYSGQHRGLLETDQKSAGVDSQNPDVKANPDGSYTVWFARQHPPGRRATSCRPCRARTGRLCCALTGHSSLGSTSRGSDFELVK